MRCPQCRHSAHPRRWWRLPDTLTCYSCGAKLKRTGRLSFSEAMLIWLIVMLPGAVLTWIGGFAGFLFGGVLALIILPVRPWDGLRYELENEDDTVGLPVATARPLLTAGKPVGSEGPPELQSSGSTLPPTSD